MAYNLKFKDYTLPLYKIIFLNLCIPIKTKYNMINHDDEVIIYFDEHQCKINQNHIIITLENNLEKDSIMFSKLLYLIIELLEKRIFEYIIMTDFDYILDRDYCIKEITSNGLLYGKINNKHILKLKGERNE